MARYDYRCTSCGTDNEIELGMTERAVEGRLYRLKKRLRTMLGGDGDA